MAKEYKKRRIWLRALCALIILGVVAGGGLMLAVYIAGELPRQPVKSDAIIVLGALVMPDGTLSTTLQHRVDVALDLYQRGYARYIINCGARGGDEPMTEADAMSEAMIRRGVPAENILRDPDSFDTKTNIANAQKLMENSGLATAIIVTSEYHLTRALWIARDAGLDATGMPSLGQDLWYNRVGAHMRESLAWINYFTGGRIRNTLFGGGA